MKKYVLLRSKKDKNKYLYCYSNPNDVMGLIAIELPLYELLKFSERQLSTSYNLLKGNASSHKSTKKLLKGYKKIKLPFTHN